MSNKKIYKPGDVFLTRYYNEDLNGFPGHWNHAAILNNGTMIVESLMDRGVVKTDINKWFEDIEDLLVLRHSNPLIALSAARQSNRFIGLRYRMMSSLFKRLGKWRISKGLNCVAVVRLSYKNVMNYDPGWIKPDDIMNDKNFTKIG